MCLWIDKTKSEYKTNEPKKVERYREYRPTGMKLITFIFNN